MINLHVGFIIQVLFVYFYLVKEKVIFKFTLVKPYYFHVLKKTILNIIIV